MAIVAPQRRLREYTAPLPFATEHLLLGLTMGDDDVAVWLRQRGVVPEVVEAEIQRQYGFLRVAIQDSDVAPLEFPDEDANVELAEASQIETPEDEPPEVCCQMSGGDAPWGRLGDGLTQHERVGVLRIIDAAANRGCEGLRVVEDYVRFVLDDRHLTEQLKRLRHELASAVSCFSMASRLASRETQADVGTTVSTATERCRADAAAVMTANFVRLQESLRSLEEFAKVLNPDASAVLEQLRYRAYTLQRAVEMTRRGLHRIGHARLYVLLDGRDSVDAFVAMAREIAAAGVDIVQWRDKKLNDRELVERGRLLREITSEAGALLIVNDRPDLAVLIGADGVHVGQDELCVKDARTIVGLDALVGVSTHSIEQARQAVLDGADYLGVGPTFPSGTKHFDAFPGLEFVRAVAAEIRLPAFAIGGIDAENARRVLAAGLRRIAVSGAVTQSPEPAAAVRRLRAILDASL
jgi:thiamine-phosphate pyrophosphorylase